LLPVGHHGLETLDVCIPVTVSTITTCDLSPAHPAPPSGQPWLKPDRPVWAVPSHDPLIFTRIGRQSFILVTVGCLVRMNEVIFTWAAVREYLVSGLGLGEGVAAIVPAVDEGLDGSDQVLD
jgi:hypothetical protein